MKTVLTQIRVHKVCNSDPRLVLAGPSSKAFFADALTPLETLIPGKTSVIILHLQDADTPDTSISTGTTSARRESGVSKTTKARCGKLAGTDRQCGNRNDPYTTITDLRSTKRKMVRSSVANGDKLSYDNTNDRDWDAIRNAILSEAESGEISLLRTKRARARDRTAQGRQKTNSTEERRAKRTRVSKPDEAADSGVQKLVVKWELKARWEDVGDLSKIATDIGASDEAGKLGVIRAQSMVETECKSSSKVSPDHSILVLSDNNVY